MILSKQVYFQIIKKMTDQARVFHVRCKAQTSQAEGYTSDVRYPTQDAPLHKNSSLLSNPAHLVSRTLLGEGAVALSRAHFNGTHMLAKLHVNQLE